MQAACVFSLCKDEVYVAGKSQHHFAASHAVEATMPVQTRSRSDKNAAARKAPKDGA